MANLPIYDKYKDSNVTWLGKIPAHWELRRAKYILRERDERWQDAKGNLLSVSQYTGVTNRRKKEGSKDPDTRAESLVGYKVAETNDLVVNIMLAWNGSLGVSSAQGVVSPAYCVYKFQDGVPWYYHNLLRCTQYRSEIKRRSRGVVESRLRIYSDDLFRLQLIKPSEEEQTQIVRFLDWKTAQINKFIRNKRRLIELLKEQKQNIINQAVTRGLNPNVKLKPSGVEWIGDIPEHWDVRRIKTVTKILRGKFSHRPRNDASLYDGIFPFIQTGDVARAGKFIVGYKQTLNEKGFFVSKQFPKGTLTMTIAANIGDVAILDFDACFPDSIVGFVPIKNVSLEFLYYTFTAMKKEFLKEAPVNTQGNLNVERIGAMSIPLPDYDTQWALVDNIEKSSAQIDQTIFRAEREIELISEYRTRLISDVVTGKVDVRGIDVPDVAEEDILALDVDAAEPDDVIEDKEDMDNAG